MSVPPRCLEQPFRGQDSGALSQHTEGRAQGVWPRGQDLCPHLKPDPTHVRGLWPVYLSSPSSEEAQPKAAGECPLQGLQGEAYVQEGHREQQLLPPWGAPNVFRAHYGVTSSFQFGRDDLGFKTKL